MYKAIHDKLAIQHACNTPFICRNGQYTVFLSTCDHILNVADVPIYNSCNLHASQTTIYHKEMATNSNFQQCEIEVLPREIEVSTRERASDSLFRNRQRLNNANDTVQSRICKHALCVRSKAALLILVWNLLIVSGLGSLLDPTCYASFVEELNGLRITTQIAASYLCFAFLFLLYPLAGCLADIRWGRYKTVVNSMCFLFWSLVMLLVFSGFVVAGISPIIAEGTDSFSSKEIATFVIVGAVFGFPMIFGALLIVCSFIAFNANVIQYGMDQLHDASTDDLVIYIHWYVWTSYVGLIPMKIGIVIWGALFLAFIPCLIYLALPILGVTLCIQRYKCHWFLIDSGSRNPYKLVYKVLKFAKDHTSPIRRSAFTYCEDELPSRLDLGKEKYGGPFTTEQVEDVKAFLGILRVLLTLGPIMMVDFSVNGILLQKFAGHLDNDIGDMYDQFITLNLKSTVIKGGGLTPVIITILIPFYVCMRPFICDYIPGMLKRIGLGMICILLSTLCTLSLDTYGHIHANATVCFLNSSPTIVIDTEGELWTTLNISSYYLIIQHFLNAIGYMLLYTATYEFICAQSPHAMKGLVVGTFFAIKGIFQLLSILIVFAPFIAWNITATFPSCGFVYYLINAIIALIGIVAYTCVAWQYQYRERDEPDNIYRYAEEYYDNAQDEPNYDYDNYDNLDVHTIN